jgi:hypothetical protein
VETGDLEKKKTRPKNKKSGLRSRCVGALFPVWDGIHERLQLEAAGISGGDGDLLRTAVFLCFWDSGALARKKGGSHGPSHPLMTAS